MSDRTEGYIIPDWTKVNVACYHQNGLDLRILDTRVIQGFLIPYWTK